ncbi:MAG: prolipoprotein diacylglyceryl transferase, partial [Kiritimatiellaceae bacterium]|nr:prolipoprotein diacylglyceryl transferase [Kiritimatiellaceae bacterium]
ALSVMFLLIYAFARIVGECFREPDSTIYLGWLTKGQLFSSVMIVGALFILWRKKLLCKPS